MTPTISVVVPAYNEEARLGPSLERIRISLPNAELLMVDDGSVDETHWWFRGRRERALALMERFGLGGKILALGCGMGANARSFACRGDPQIRIFLLCPLPGPG